MRSRSYQVPAEILHAPTPLTIPRRGPQRSIVQTSFPFISGREQTVDFWVGFIAGIGRTSKGPETLTSFVFGGTFFLDVLTLMIRDTAANADRKKIQGRFICRQRFSIMQYYLKNNILTSFKISRGIIQLYFLPYHQRIKQICESRAQHNSQFRFVRLSFQNLTFKKLLFLEISMRSYFIQSSITKKNFSTAAFSSGILFPKIADQDFEFQNKRKGKLIVTHRFYSLVSFSHPKYLP